MNKLTAAQRLKKVDIEGDLNAAKDFADDIHGEISAFFDSKSEKWQESDKGQAVETWRDEWAELRDTLESAADAVANIANEVES